MFSIYPYLLYRNCLMSADFSWPEEFELSSVFWNYYFIFRNNWIGKWSQTPIKHRCLLTAFGGGVCVWWQVDLPYDGEFHFGDFYGRWLWMTLYRGRCSGFDSLCFQFHHACRDMRHLTMGIHSEIWVIRRFRRCANVIECTYTNLDSIAYYTRSLYMAYCY